METSTAYSQAFSRRSLSSLAKKSAFFCLFEETSDSFFISNMIEMYSTPSPLKSRRT